MRADGPGLPRTGTITHPDEIERRLAEAVGSLCLVTASGKERLYYRRAQARVESAVQGKVGVTFLHPVSHPEPPFVVDLEVIHEGAGLLRLHTMALAAAPESLLVPLPSRLEIDRRLWPRVPVRLEARITLCDQEWHERESHTVRVQDLSPIGAAFVAETPLQLGDRLLLHLSPSLPPVRAQVVRAARTAGLLVTGVVLVGAPPAVRQYLLQLLGQSS